MLNFDLKFWLLKTLAVVSRHSSFHKLRWNGSVQSPRQLLLDAISWYWFFLHRFLSIVKTWLSKVYSEISLYSRLRWVQGSSCGDFSPFQTRSETFWHHHRSLLWPIGPSLLDSSREHGSYSLSKTSSWQDLYQSHNWASYSSALYLSAPRVDLFLTLGFWHQIPWCADCWSQL